MGESQFFEGRPDISFTLSPECCAINPTALESADFPSNHFKHMPDGHTTWNCMGVNNEVGSQSALGKGQIFLVGDQPDDSFLTMPGCKLVADFGDTQVAGPYLDEP